MKTCRKCDGKGFYCVVHPLKGSPPDNRAACEICGGLGWERCRTNPIPGVCRTLSSFKRDELCDILRTIFEVHMKFPVATQFPLSLHVEQVLQRLSTE